jgi:hypothetical protein
MREENLILIIILLFRNCKGQGVVRADFGPLLSIMKTKHTVGYEQVTNKNFNYPSFIFNNNFFLTFPLVNCSQNLLNYLVSQSFDIEQVLPC